MYKDNIRIDIPTNPATKVHDLGREMLRGTYIAVFDSETYNLDEVIGFDTGYSEIEA